MLDKFFLKYEGGQIDLPAPQKKLLSKIPTLLRLTNFWRTLEMSLIYCKIIVILTCHQLMLLLIQQVQENFQ